jgi:hypothetical protein
LNFVIAASPKLVPSTGVIRAQGLCNEISVSLQNVSPECFDGRPLARVAVCYRLAGCESLMNGKKAGQSLGEMRKAIQKRVIAWSGTN